MSEATYLGPATECQFTAGADLDSGDVIELADGRAGVVQGLAGVANGEIGVAATAGRFRLPVATATTFNAGANVDWDDTAKLCVADGAGDFAVGRAEVAKGAGPTTMVVLLNDQGPT